MNDNFLENIANFATFAGLITVAYQIYMSKKEQRIQHEKQEKQKAIELAEIYAKNIIPDIGFLSGIFEQSKIYEKYFKNIKYCDLKEFDKHELQEVLRGYDIDSINKEIINIDREIIMSSIVNYKNDMNKDEFNKNLDDLLFTKISSTEIESVMSTEEEIAGTISDEEIKKRKKIINSLKKKQMYQELYCQNIYLDILEKTLNSLEYFCMYFNSGIADEEVVYQSLHQSFLSMVKMLYFRIAYQNENGKDKYYTNIIELYNKWSYRYFLDEQKEVKDSRGLARKPKKIKR